MNHLEHIEQTFRKLYSRDPLLVRSPGRVNLIGEHTDYNMGFVLPAAIDKSIYFAVAPRKDLTCSVYSVDMDDSVEFSIDRYEHSEKGWPNYLIGVVDQLKKAG